MKRINNWDILRIFAALSVVYLHWYTGAFKHNPALFRWFDPVPTFVCLSGLVIPGSYSKSVNWKEFVAKRVRRVYPAFFASFLLVIALGGHVWPTFMVYLTCGFIVSPLAMNGPLWSLMAEEILYCSHIIARLRKLWSPLTAFSMCILCTYLAFRFGENPVVDRNLRVASSFFLANTALFYMEALSKLSFVTYGAVWAFVRVLGVHYGIGGNHALSVPISSLSALMLVMALRNAPQFKWQIPDLSYGVYIYHFPILKVLPSPLVFPLVFGLALGSWYLLEKPALQLKEFRVSHRMRSLLQGLRLRPESKRQVLPLPEGSA